MGRLIVLEGLDGSGKATQARLLTAALEERGLAPRRLSFPCYDSPACQPVKMYLSGAFGEHPADVGGYAAAVFFAVDRYASFQTDWRQEYEAGGLFVADRYTTSNGVYQAGKLPRERWDGFLDWLFDLEYNKMAIPRPDRVIYLDLPAEISSTLMAKRYGGDDSRRDIHEKDLDFQKHSREAALYCAKREGWQIVACARQGAMRPAEEIAAEVLAVATKEG